MEKRIIFKEDSTYTDYSSSLNDYKDSNNVNFSLASTTDYIYIGSRNPFNSLFFKSGTTVNAVSDVINIDYWDGNSWQSSIDIIDETSEFGTAIPFEKSGYITFSTNTNEGWSRDDTNNDRNTVEGLTSFNILGLYWLRIKFVTSSATNFDLKYVGISFCNDNDLYSEYPIFNRPNIKTAFESGKTDWEEQEIAASEIVISDLMDRNVIKHEGQLLERNRLKRSCVSKTAEIIFRSFGDDYVDDAIRARNEYQERLTAPVLYVDLNQNTKIDEPEKRKSTGWLQR